MKRSFLLILIGSALLLSVAHNANAEAGRAPLPSKPPTVQSHKPTADHRNDAEERHPPQMVESPFETQILESLRAIARQQETARAEDQANEKRWWPPSPSWAIVYVTVIYVVVAIFQWRAIHRQANIANETLVETQKAIEISKLALQSNRPLVIVSKIAMRVEGNTGFIPKVTFHNYGRNPAIIVDVSLGLELKADVTNLKESDLLVYQLHSTQTQVIGANEHFTDMITLMWVSPDTLMEILSRPKTFVAHGRITYRDVFPTPEPYKSHFCWFYVPPLGSPTAQGFFYIGPKELNWTT